MPEHADQNQSPFAAIGSGVAIGLAAGALIGAAGGLHTTASQAYQALGMQQLAWSTLRLEILAGALYGAATLGILQTLLGLWCRSRWSRTPLRHVFGAALFAGTALVLLYPLNRTSWFPAVHSAAGLALNGGFLLAGVVGGAVAARWSGLEALRRLLANRTFARAGAVLGAVALIGSSAAWAVARRDTAAVARPLNVVIISIDTLRWDHMSLNGYQRPTTPNIDAFAQTALDFRQATTPRPKTTPSMASMLTGLYPHNSGVRRLVDSLDPRHLTLAEIFKEHGYRTGAVVCNYVLNGRATGLGTGFDMYDDRTPEVQGTQRDAAPATDAAIAWLERNGGSPRFLWVHYMDPHGPYTPPPPYDERFVSSQRGTWHVALEEIPRASRLGDEQDVNVYIDRYDGEIAYTDHHVGRLLDAIDAIGMRDDTIVVLTADHGESLGEHQYFFEHGKYTYDVCARIPLLVRYPGVDAGRRFDAPVEITDVYPTVLALASLGSPAATDGIDLMPLIDGGRNPRPAVAFIERSTMMKAARTPDWKLIYTYGTDGEVERRELYDLVDDPAETRNLYDDAPAAGRALEAPLLAWIGGDRAMAERPGKEAEGEHASAEVLKKLRALGYVQ